MTSLTHARPWNNGEQALSVVAISAVHVNADHLFDQCNHSTREDLGEDHVPSQNLATNRLLTPLMDIVLMLGEITTDSHQLSEIPPFLAAVLGFQHTAFGVVRHTPKQPIQFLLSAASGPHIETALLNLMKDSAYSSGKNDLLQALYVPIDSAFALATWDGRHPVVMTQNFNSGDTLVFVTYPDPASPPTATMRELLFPVFSCLGRTLETLLAWQNLPPELGPPLATLTPTEWRVLSHLGCTDSEKLLAGQLGMAAHTLHSHIKHIYAKLGVQSRLSAMDVFRRAARGFRQKERVKSLVDLSPPSPTADKGNG